MLESRIRDGDGVECCLQCLTDKFKGEFLIGLLLKGP